MHALTVSRYGDAAEVRVQTRTLSGDTVLLLELKDRLDGLVAATLDLANSLDRAALIDGFRADPWPDEEIMQLREAAFRAPPSVLPTV